MNKESKCDNTGSCNLELNEEVMGRFLEGISHDRILMLLRSHERSHFLVTLEKYGYEIKVVKREWK